jgi:thymidylate synthase
MKITHIEAKTLPEAWFLCIKGLGSAENALGVRRYTIDRGSFKGHDRLEFDCISIHVEFPSSRPLVPDVPVGVPAPCTQEYVNGYLPYLMAGKKQKNEDYTYGEDIEFQIPEVIKMYREDGYNTNQAFMALGNRESLKLRDPQCLRMIDTRISYGALHFVVYFRSWDLWGGFPANLAAIQILKEYMADEIGVKDGELIAWSKGLHLYDHCWDLANKVLQK